MPEREFYRWQVSSFTVLLALDVVERISQQLRNPRFNPAEEQGGLLYGNILDTNRVEIDGLEFIRSRHHRGAPYDLSLTERHNLERRVRSLARRDGPRPIGYFRTHLRPGLFLDQSDFALMTEAFSDGPGIALAVRMTEPGNASAGIFFWEGGDIDRSQTKLMFPFDAEKLRAQGPIDHNEPLPAAPPQIAARASKARAAWKGRARPWMVGLACGLAGGILAFAALSAFHRTTRRPLIALDAASTQRAEFARSDISPFSQGSEPALDAPPAAFEADDAQPAAAPAPRDPEPERKPERKPEPAPLPPAPPPERAPPAVVARSAPAPLPVVPLQAAPPPATPTASEPAYPAPPPAELRRVNVDISVEAKDEPLLKRMASVAGHVPLLGRLHGLRRAELVSPRPSSNLVPQIPARVSRELDDEIRVDVEATIDESGVVRNAEVTQGAGTGFGPLAADKVRSVSWQPARSGDRNVAMDVVVHYRFNPARE